MGEINTALGGGSEFEYEGKVYKISPWSYKIQGEFERYLEREAYQSLSRLRSLIGEEDYKDQLNRLNRDITGGVYSFGSDVVARALSNTKHLTYLLFLQLKPSHRDITLEKVDEMVKKQLEEIVLKMGEANADPTQTPTEASRT